MEGPGLEGRGPKGKPLRVRTGGVRTGRVYSLCHAVPNMACFTKLLKGPTPESGDLSAIWPTGLQGSLGKVAFLSGSYFLVWKMKG